MGVLFVDRGDALADRVFGQFRDTAQIELVHDLLAVSLHRLHADEQSLGDLRSGMPSAIICRVSFSVR